MSQKSWPLQYGAPRRKRMTIADFIRAVFIYCFLFTIIATIALAIVVIVNSPQRDILAAHPTILKDEMASKAKTDIEMWRKRLLAPRDSMTTDSVQEIPSTTQNVSRRRS